jgi:hypothetical protein
MEQADPVNDERDSHQQTAPYDFVKAYDVIQVALKEAQMRLGVAKVEWMSAESGTTMNAGFSVSVIMSARAGGIGRLDTA